MESEKNNFIVTKSNHLIEAGYRLSLNEQRLVLMAISKLDSRKPLPKDNDFTISASEFSIAFNIPIKQAYENLESAANRLYEQDIKTYDGLHKTRERFRWVDCVKYWDGEGKVTLSFSNKIIPYLTLLHTQLTSYNLKQISSLSTSYAIRFYELLIQFKKTGNRWLALDLLKERLELDKKYDRFFNLKVRVIQPSIDEINEKTDLSVSWEVVKKGRIIVGLKFNFTEKEKSQNHRCPRTLDMVSLMDE